MYKHAKYLDQRSFSSKIIVLTQAYTNIGPTCVKLGTYYPCPRPVNTGIQNDVRVHGRRQGP